MKKAKWKCEVPGCGAPAHRETVLGVRICDDCDWQERLAFAFSKCKRIK